jgi:hypothetical protein
MTLVCSNLPSKSACLFAPATVPTGSGQTDIVVTMTTTASSAAIAGPRIFYAAWLPLTGLGLIAIVLPAIPRKRRIVLLLLLTLLFTGMPVLLAGCGASSVQPDSNTGTPKGTFTVTVIGTSGNVTNTTTFSLTVN